jgi:AcrR family transcriptional regulator
MPAKNNDRAREIMDVAAALFAQHGYHGVSVRDICSRLGVNSSTVSYYFGGKSGLYLSLLRAQFEAYENALDAIISENPDPKEELTALCDRLGEIHALCPHLSVISSRESCGPSPEYIKALSEHEAKYRGGHLAELIRAGQRQGLFDPALNPIYVSRILSMVFNSQIIACSTCGFLYPETRFSDTEYYATVKSIMFGGILYPSSPEQAGRRAADDSERTRRTTKGQS